MLGLALTAANKDTSGLKHHRNVRYPRYRPHSVARMHVINLWSNQWLNCSKIARATGTSPIQLAPLSAADMQGLLKQVSAIYRRAYRWRASKAVTAHTAKLVHDYNGTELRHIVRTAVALLDSDRLGLI